MDTVTSLMPMLNTYLAVVESYLRLRQEPCNEEKLVDQKVSVWLIKGGWDIE